MASGSDSAEIGTNGTTLGSAAWLEVSGWFTRGFEAMWKMMKMMMMKTAIWSIWASVSGSNPEYRCRRGSDKPREQSLSLKKGTSTFCEGKMSFDALIGRRPDPVLRDKPRLKTKPDTPPFSVLVHTMMKGWSRLCATHAWPENVSHWTCDLVFYTPETIWSGKWNLRMWTHKAKTEDTGGRQRPWRDKNNSKQNTHLHQKKGGSPEGEGLSSKVWQWELLWEGRDDWLADELQLRRPESRSPAHQEPILQSHWEEGWFKQAGLHVSVLSWPAENTFWLFRENIITYSHDSFSAQKQTAHWLILKILFL